MEKNIYTTPEMEIIYLGNIDIITASRPGVDEGEDSIEGENSIGYSIENDFR